MNIGEQLKKYRKDHELSQKEMAAKLGLKTQQAYAYYESQESFDAQTVIEFQTKLGISLLQQNNFVSREIKTKNKNTVKPLPYEDFMEVPYLPAYAQAGYLSAHTDFISHDETLDTMLVPKEFERGNYLVIEVVGNSMDDGTRKAICEGDKLLIKELDTSYYVRDRLHYRDVLYVLATKEEGVIVKEIINHDVMKGIITCHSWNPLYKDFTVKVKDIIRLFYVKKIVERKIRF